MRTEGLAGAVVAVAIVATAWTTTGASPAGLGQPAPSTEGRRVFEQRCGQCHGGDGNGGEMGPAITTRLPVLSDTDITTLIRQGRVAQGMPAQVVPSAEMTALLRHLRTIERLEPPLPRRTVRLIDGATIEGEVLGEGFEDLQIRTSDKRIHLLRRQGDRVRRVTSEVDWPTYNGETGGNRHTTLRGIDKANVTRLAPRWMATIGEAGSLQVTPVVVDGIMYVTAANECVALDAGSGRRLWRYKRPRTKGVSGGWANRGVAVAGDRVFMMTDHAHVIALDRFTGALLWDTALADWRQNYAASSAPLPAGDLGRDRRRGGRARSERLRGRGRSGHRQGSVAVPHRAAAGRAGVGDLAGQGHRTRRRADLVHGQLRPGARPGVLADGQPVQGVRRQRPARRQPVRVVHPGARAQDRAPSMALPVHARTICGTGMPRRRRSSPTSSGTGARVRCCCTPIGTASSTCSTASRASACSRRRS